MSLGRLQNLLLRGRSVGRAIRANPRRSAVWGAAGAAVLFLAVVVLSSRWVTSVSRDAIYRAWDELPDNEVGLVLGTSKRLRNGNPNPHFQNRIAAAAELFEKGKIRHILVSGDNQSKGYNEPSDMRDALLALGVPKSAVTLDYAGLRTLDSIVRAKKIFGLTRFTIITQEYHNYRAVFIARHHGCDVAAYCAPKAPYSPSDRTEMREYFARVKAILDLYVLDTQPLFLGEKEPIGISLAGGSLNAKSRFTNAGLKVSGSAGLESILEEIRKKRGVPALGAAVLVEGRVAAMGVTGVRKLGDATAAEKDDLFHIGSCAKSMTATLVALLVEEGKLRWDMTLPEALPELAAEMDPAYAAVTLTHLLAHRSGLPTNDPKGKTLYEMHFLPGTPREQRVAYARMLLSEPPDYEPGSKFVYSNAGYAVAGAITEYATDTQWEDLMRERLFAPLGMESPGYGAMGTTETLDQPWQHRVAQSGEIIPVAPGPLSDNPPVIGPAGRVHCNISDWAKFAAVHLKGARGEKTILKRETFQILHAAPFGGDYTLGLLATEREWGGGRVLTHAGSNTMNYAVVWLAPLKNFAVVVATNQGGDAAFQACDETAFALIQRYLVNSPRMSLASSWPLY